MRPPNKPDAWHRTSPGPALVIRNRETVSLVRGPAAGDAIRTLGIERVWSPRGRGYVIARTSVPDLEAWAQSRRLIAVITSEPSTRKA